MLPTFPFPDPRELLTLLPRVTRLLADAEELVAGIAATRRAADEVVAGAAAVVARAEQVVERAEGTVVGADELVVRATGSVVRVEDTAGSADALINRVVALLDLVEEPITTLQPVLERLAETTDPHEVDAIIAVIDQMPEVASIISTMSSVAPDLHEVLRLTGEISEMLTKIPFVNRKGD